MSATKVETTVAETLLHLAKIAPEEMALLEKDVPKKEEFLMYLNEKVELQHKIADAFSQHESLPNHEVISSKLEEFYGKERVQLMKNAMKQVTYRLNFVDNGGEHMDVRITRHGKELTFPSGSLASSTDVLRMSNLQIASIVVEAVQIALAAIGITVDLDEDTIERIAIEVVQQIANVGAIATAIGNLVQADWSDVPARIFALLVVLFDQNILWTIMRAICSQMTWYEWLKTSAVVTCKIMMDIATTGVALIAQIALILINAAQFAQKLAAMSYLNSMHKFFLAGE